MVFDALIVHPRTIGEPPRFAIPMDQGAPNELRRALVRFVTVPIGTKKTTPKVPPPAPEFSTVSARISLLAEATTLPVSSAADVREERIFVAFSPEPSMSTQGFICTEVVPTSNTPASSLTRKRFAALLPLIPLRVFRSEVP